MLKNTVLGYGLIARSFHWIMAILILGMIALGYVMTSIPASEFRSSLIGLHKASGLLVLCLVTLRILWRSYNIQPADPKTVPFWQTALAKANIFVMYCLLFLIPVTGLGDTLLSKHTLSFYGLFTIQPLPTNMTIAIYCGNIHEIIPYVLLACIALHFLGALYNHIILKNGVFLKMWRGS